MSDHILKTWSNAWRAVESGVKSFEYRRDDRGFKVGDVLVLRQWDPAKRQCNLRPLSGSTALSDYIDLRVRVTFILRGLHGVPDGYCVMSIERLDEPA